jgi:hypothetical protein
MNLLPKFMALCGLIFLLNASEISPDQIIEFWQPKRESAYFETVANFDYQSRIIFDLRNQRIINDFYHIRQLPVVAQNILPVIANDNFDADDYLDSNEIVCANQQVLQSISSIQKLLNFVKSIFY